MLLSLIAGIDGGLSTTEASEESEEKNEEEEQFSGFKATVEAPVNIGKKDRVRKKPDMSAAKYHSRMVELEERKLACQEAYYSKMIEIGERRLFAGSKKVP